VGTDTDRLDANTDHLKSLIGRSPLADLVQANVRPRGYFATRLDATWASFPYLHNGSVPTLWDLLEKPTARPRAWSLERPGERDRFDDVRIGFTVPPRDSFEHRKLETLGRRGARDIYHGHDFGTELSNEDKRALIEYLKTL
jgi:hypothetical protein